MEVITKGLCNTLSLTPPRSYFLVELGEDILPAGHVVHCAGIEVPLISMAVAISVRWSWARGSSRWTSNRAEVLCFGEAASTSSVLEQQSKVLCSSGAHTSAMSSACDNPWPSGRMSAVEAPIEQPLIAIWFEKLIAVGCLVST